MDFLRRLLGISIKPIDSQESKRSDNKQLQSFHGTIHSADQQENASPFTVCPSCGEQLRAGSVFCPYCGHGINLTTNEYQVDWNEERKRYTVRFSYSAPRMSEETNEHIKHLLATVAEETYCSRGHKMRLHDHKIVWRNREYLLEGTYICPTCEAETLAHTIRSNIEPSETDHLLEQIASLAEIIVSYTETGKPAQPHKDTKLSSELLSELHGKTISTSSSVIKFGENSQIGDISIRDVANGNITTININL